MCKPFGVCLATDDACLTAADCPTAEDECVVCGDGVLVAPPEECDDNDTVAGDGCSDTCRFEGTCRLNGLPAPCGGCATAADCDLCGFCSGGGCTCE